LSDEHLAKVNQKAVNIADLKNEKVRTLCTNWNLNVSEKLAQHNHRYAADCVFNQQLIEL
jgi:hypothetical protein